VDLYRQLAETYVDAHFIASANRSARRSVLVNGGKGVHGEVAEVEVEFVGGRFGHGPLFVGERRCITWP
jgi:hypothetical protein